MKFLFHLFICFFLTCQNLCINEAVQSLKSLALMNDCCLELQKPKKGLIIILFVTSSSSGNFTFYKTII